MPSISLALDTNEYPLTVVNGTELQLTLSGPAGPAGPAGPTGPAVTVETTIIDGSANAVAGNAVFDALALKAPLASPTFTGTVTATGAVNTGARVTATRGTVGVGTVSTNLSLTNITGTSTDFLSRFVVGDSITFNTVNESETRVITAIASDTSMTTLPFSGPSASGAEAYTHTAASAVMNPSGAITGSTGTFSGAVRAAGVTVLSGSVLTIGDNATASLNATIARNGAGTLLINASNSGGMNLYGRFAFSNDNAADIGLVATQRPRNVYVGTGVFTTNLTATGTVTAGGTNTWTGSTFSGAQAFSGAVSVTDATASTTTTTGALKVAGGLGVVGAVNAGAITGTTGTFSGIVKAASGTNSSISYGVSGFSSGISIFSNEWTSLIGSGQYIASFSRGQNCRFRNDTGIGWTTQNASPNDTPDVAIRRYGVGELIINNGTNAATNPASLRLLNLTASGTITGSNLSGLNTGDETAARITALITTTAHKEALFAALGVPAFDTLAAANASGDITIGKPFYNRDVAVAGLDITTA